MRSYSQIDRKFSIHKVLCHGSKRLCMLITMSFSLVPEDWSWREEIGTIFWLMFGVMAICVVFVLISNVRGNKSQRIFEYAIWRAGLTKPDRSYRSDHGKKGIAIDLSARKICIYESESATRIFTFSEVCECELIGARTSPAKTEGGGYVLAGHAIGTALGGFVGGVAGGMVAEKLRRRKVKQIGMSVTCLTLPCSSILLLD